MRIVHYNPLRTNAVELEYLYGYERQVSHPGRAFDPGLLVQLVREQYPTEEELAHAFARCTREWPETEEELYTHFLPPHEHDTRWKYAGGFTLVHPVLGHLIVDTIQDENVPGGRAIGGMEYLDRVLGRVR